jgi:hypothetical protein
MTVYMYGGNSRSNASIAITPNNDTLEVNNTYSIDVSSNAMLVMIPDNEATSNSFQFEYYALGI